MNTIAQFAPSDFVDYLTELQVPDYDGYPGGFVEITKYQSANPAFGGSATSPAAVLNAALVQIAQTKHDTSVLSAPGSGRIFTGQGSMDRFIDAMSFINKYKDDFKKVPALKKYFVTADFLQAMADDACFGLDCVGFVGTYLVEAGLETSFTNRRPLDFAALFPPVKKLSDVSDMSMVMLTSGLHIQILEKVHETGDGFIKVTLCQSTAGGIQVNRGVVIHSGGGNYLPVEAFRSAMADPAYKQKYEADKAQRKADGKKEIDFETYLRQTMTKPGTPFGYAGGAIFNTSHTGNVPNPPGVSGSVYIGVATNGVSIQTPDF